MNTDAAQDLKKYIEKQILPSVEDIEGLDDKSRKHVQKLVYTNLVDRFDVMVDLTILDNCRTEYVIEAISPSLTEPINESYLLRLLMNADNIQDAIDERLKDTIRSTILRRRHSQKLQFLLKMFDCIEYTGSKQQVQVGSGKIVSAAKKAKVNVPQSVCGYADWLYSRRNAVVHGAGSSKFLKNDKQQMRKLYNYSCPDSFNIKIGAIKLASTFYLCIVDLITKQ